MSTDKIYIIFRSIYYEQGNPVNIDRQMLGCYKKYSDAKVKMNKILKEEIGWEKFEEGELEKGECECCKEIDVMLCESYASGEKLSLYECKPH